jgi:precorrin-6B methylase 2
MRSGPRLRLLGTSVWACLPIFVLFQWGAALHAQQQIFDPRSLAPYVPTPQRVVEEMLSMAEVTKDDTVYDLGSGDGRILITAAERFRSKAVGIEINGTLVKQTQDKVRELGLAERVTVIQEHMLDADLSPATVVTVYLLSSSMEQLRPKLEKELKDGTRIVAHDFQIDGWTALETLEVPGETRNHRIYLYKIPESRRD